VVTTTDPIFASGRLRQAVRGKLTAPANNPAAPQLHMRRTDMDKSLAGGVIVGGFVLVWVVAFWLFALLRREL